MNKLKNFRKVYFLFQQELYSTSTSEQVKNFFLRGASFYHI